jgi:hypothetical protein
MFLAISLCSVNSAFAEPSVPLAVKSGDTIVKILEGYKGKRVTVRLHGGEELSGKVKTITRELVHLEELMRREFFDAVIDVNRIEALIIRVKE